MKTYEFQSDRSDALRKQLVEMPTELRHPKHKSRMPQEHAAPLSSTNQGLQRKPHPSRRVLLAIGAASVGAIVLSGAPKAVDQAPNQYARPAETAPLISNDAYAGIPGDQIQHAGADVDFIWDAKDPYYGYNKYPIVARVHIDSIDGGRVFSPISNQYVFPQTVGKMTVREVYKGTIKPGDRLNYSRVGGTVIYDDYWNSLLQVQRDKILRLNGGQKPADKKYVQQKITDDIDVEVGKEYVALLTPQSSKDGKLIEYSMDGFQFGLREAKGSGPSTTVLNNETKEWESLGSIVKLP
ncbi:hypothetical protein [Arthrobacter sp. FW306-04-A]|uniref:hypothetical protein n=1 Tax=Arthrobacter sp. FW306-04-A TaxID=2879619 RepID=UPI0037C12902|nr:hypothetical protein LFT43_00890 [Arthrobacter sp. FW306-04-A]